MFEENKDFYPTPKALINKMLQDVDLREVQTILEPSAGKGNIVEEIIARKKAFSSNFWSGDKKYDIDCIEIDKNLRYILQGKGYRVIHDDFLTFETFKRYDLIIANFPFSQGDKHLLKALDLIQYGGKLVCLINAETIKNPYSNIRQDLVRKLKKYNATIEYLQEEFISAERSTNVEVALVKVKIENNNKSSVILDNLKQEEQFNKQYNNSSNTLIDGNFINGIIQQYQFELKAGLKLINEYYSLQPLIFKTFKKDNCNKGSILCLSINGEKYDESIQNDNLINAYIKKVRYKYWEALFSNEQFTGLLTSNLLREYREKIADMQNYDFSLYNIKEIQKQMNNHMVKGVEDTILSLFDEFSAQHSWYKECRNNIHYYDGWATNKAHKINKKIIIPLTGYGMFGDRLDYHYKFYEKLKDIEHVFNYLDSGETKETDLRELLQEAENQGQTKNIKTKYFSINVYKKGTTHLAFLNEELLKKFNIFGSLKKGWLPPSYAKKEYKNMTDKEKTVINEFEGKASYEKVIKNTGYYLYNPSDTLMIEG